MKKTFALLCVMMMTVCCILGGCKKEEKDGGDNASSTTETAASSSTTGTATADLSNSKYVGTWKPAKTEFKGEEQNSEEILGELFDITLNADGTAVIVTDEGESTGNWKETSKGVSIKGEELDLDLTAEGDYLFFKMLGVTFYFEKQ